MKQTQVQKEKAKQEHNKAEAETETVPGVRDKTLDDDVDDILDEIDSVLEANAEEFVRGYIQKGGQ